MLSPLRLERLLRELSQTELASATGIPQWRISLLERGKPPSSDERSRLAGALKLKEVDLWPAQEAQAE